MRPLLYLSCLVLALPGIALAAALLALDSAIAAHSLLGFLGVLLDLFVWLLPWGLLIIAAALLALLLGGLSERLRWLASLCVATLAIGSSAVVLVLTASHGGFSADSLLFFTPAALSACGSTWLTCNEWPGGGKAPDPAAPLRSDGPA